MAGDTQQTTRAAVLAARCTPEMREALIRGGRFQLSLTMPDDLWFVWLFDSGRLTVEGEAVRSVILQQERANA